MLVESLLVVKMKELESRPDNLEARRLLARYQTQTGYPDGCGLADH